MKEQKIKEILMYLEINEDIFVEAIEELDAYNGYLGDNRIYNMDELDELFSNMQPLDILYRAFYGKDEYGEEFNPNRDYFYFNGYGNLVSLYSKDYSDYLNEDFILELSENLNNLYLDGELETLLNELVEIIENENE